MRETVRGNDKQMLLYFTWFKTKLFMMIIGDSPAYEPPITATCGPVGSWLTIERFLAASSESDGSTAVRYSELASEGGEDQHMGLR